MSVYENLGLNHLILKKESTSSLKNHEPRLEAADASKVLASKTTTPLKLLGQAPKICKNYFFIEKIDASPEAFTLIENLRKAIKWDHAFVVDQMNETPKALTHCLVMGLVGTPWQNLKLNQTVMLNEQKVLWTHSVMDLLAQPELKKDLWAELKTWMTEFSKH